jgi:hypothetical protein
MTFRVAIALIALAAPVFAQHGGTHGGSFGSRGFAGHAGFSGHSGFSQPNGFARPGQPIRYGALGRAGFQRNGPLNDSRPPIPYNGNRFMGRPSSFSRNAGSSPTWDRDRDRFGARRRSFQNWYARIYPTWLGYGYPYGIDPGFYDWGDSDNSASDNSAYDQGGALAAYPSPYSDEGYEAPNQQPSAAQPTAPPTTTSPEQPLTLIFKSGRAPVKVQNYMMTAKLLTDLDSQHNEQIPLDQIDVAATQRVNSAAGVDFQIPSASRD